MDFDFDGLDDFLDLPFPGYLKKDEEPEVDPDLLPPGLGWDPNSPLPEPDDDIPF